MTISVVVSEVCILAHYVLFSKVEPHSQINVWSAITTCLGIQRSWFFTVPSLTVNNPVWYISVLLLCYLTFYLLTRYHGRLPLFLVYLGMIFLGFSVCEYDINFPFLTLESARGYYSFYTGLLLAMLLQRNRITGKMGLICFSIIAGFVLTYVKAPSIYQPGLSYLLAVVIYPCLIILFQTDFVKKRFHHPTWGLWGKISFDVYIWHGVLLTILKSAMELFSFEDILQVRAGMYIFMFICEVVGILSYYLLEKNINKKVNKRFPELLQSLNAVLR